MFNVGGILNNYMTLVFALILWQPKALFEYLPIKKINKSFSTRYFM